MYSDWDESVYRARINDAGQHLRFEACSPNAEEIAQYRGYALSASRDTSHGQPRALVLGMTPELRCMAAAAGFELISADRNPAAIAIYQDWLQESARSREQIIDCDWSVLGEHINGGVDVVLGDGVFGNIPGLEGHHNLLKELISLLNPGGAIILRQALIPRSFLLEDYEAMKLLDKYRAGQLSDAEFGAAMRLWGMYRLAYNPDTCLLDNRIVYDHYETLRQSGVITPAELEIINRYYFAGKNMILPQDSWEEILVAAGLDFEVQPLAGRDWYRYYPVYCCQPTVQ
jgi:hypothetical protein